MSDSRMTPFKSGRPMTIVGAIAAGLGLVGFLVGISEPVEAKRSTRSLAVTPATALPAPTYREINSTIVGANAGWETRLATLKQDRPGILEKVVLTPAMKDAALHDRLRTRAFDGAPPVVPHRIEHQSSTSCLVCHGEGLKLGEKIATKVSHPHFANCLQCHIEQSGSVPLLATVSEPMPSNSFAGVLRSGPGSRAMPGAPPTIPHTTHLRGDCLSCHGLVARPGLRTTHPWLTNCTQCHAADGEAERPHLLTESEPIR